MAILDVLRIHQWYKNLLCLSALLVATVTPTLSSLLLVIGFCFASSAVYVFNDIMDRKDDALRSDRKDRPIASGALSVQRAIVLLPVLFLTSWIVWPHEFSFRWVLLYWGVNFFYNLIIKKQCGYGLSTALCVTACYLARIMPLVSLGGVQPEEYSLIVSIALIIFPLVIWKQRSYLHKLQGFEEPFKLIGVSGIGLFCVVTSLNFDSGVLLVWPFLIIAYLKILSTSNTREPYLAIFASSRA